MADLYESLLSNALGRQLLSAISLPVPVELERHSRTNISFISGNVLVGGAPGSRMLDTIFNTLTDSNANIQISQASHNKDALSAAAEKANVQNFKYVDTSADAARFKGLVFDATGIESSDQLRELFHFFQPVARKMENCGRILIIGTPPESGSNPQTQTAQRALEGFVRSFAKEVGKRGATCNLVYVTRNAEKHAESAVRFFLSPKSAFVDAQHVHVSRGKNNDTDIDWKFPLKNKVALVTGAARGIGEAIATTLARDGAHVVCLDIPQAEDDLKRVASRIGGSYIDIDITGEDAPARIAEHLKTHHDGVDIVVHNAGITRDKTLGGMKEPLWDLVMDINLCAEERINTALLDQDTLRQGGRIVCVSSMSGIAGNFGQTNYATSKAGVIGMVDSMAPIVSKKEITINAVAPGFIETAMTDAMPMATREIGRRLNSLKQGGQPVDVAEAIAFFANPASAGLNGNTIRVCGQNLLGA